MRGFEVLAARCRSLTRFLNSATKLLDRPRPMRLRAYHAKTYVIYAQFEERAQMPSHESDPCSVDDTMERAYLTDTRTPHRPT